MKAENANRPSTEAAVDHGAAASGVSSGLIAGATGLAFSLAALALTFYLYRRLKELEGDVEALPSTLGIPKTQTAVADRRPPTTCNDDAHGDDGQLLPGDKETGDIASTEALPPVIAKRFEKLEDRVKELEEQSDDEEGEDLETVPFPEVHATVSGDEIDESPHARPPRSVTVEKMVAWTNEAGLSMESVKATFGLLGNFTRSEEGDNWLVQSGDEGESYLFPRVNRFESASHFRSAYNDYYDCANPSAGTVVIEQPALVSSDPQGGWKLKDKGRLSVTS
jgi:hypothetical protein